MNKADQLIIIVVLKTHVKLTILTMLSVQYSSVYMCIFVQQVSGTCRMETL